MTVATDPLSGFDPRIADWFLERHGPPTDVQARAWPRILAGEHLLATAPTGSGKTLCAFLVPLQQLLTGAWTPGRVRVLYISPLKALNNDIRRNLLEPLAELSARWRDQGTEAPAIRVETRSGDTSSADRRRMGRHPPEILITTPESLNILLTSAGGRAMLGGVQMVILDEIHAVAGNRRGLWLMHGVEALTELAGDFQRIALSATVRPMNAIADLVGGHAPGPDGAPEARTRIVAVVASDAPRRLDLKVKALAPDPLPGDGGLDAIGPIAGAIAEATAHNRATLAFANSRALCEKLAMRINDGRGETLAWAHHGSLSREIRLDVEARLKAGDLRAIVATSSLEMGIDIGSLDEVLMVQAPPSVAATIQRAGRAGHGVGEISRATLYPTHPQDALECAALARAALAGDIEETRIPGPALDVLAQMIVVRLALASRSADALYDAVRCVHPYRNLARELFDPVLAMLLGRYADARLKELAPRLLEDPDLGVLHLRRGTLLALYGSGGMIPDRGYYQLRHAESGNRLGELDEEFVWENGPGRTFAMGSRQWRVQRVTHNDVFVTPAPEAAFAPPFWRADDRDRDAHLSRRLGEFLRECETVLIDHDGDADAAAEALSAHLAADALDAGARAMIVDHLIRQRAHTGSPLPHIDHLLVERVRRGPGGYDQDGGQLVLHTLAGGAVNRPWGLALAARWRETFGETPELFAANDAIVIQGGAEVSEETLAELLVTDGLTDLLRSELEDSGTFGARFRESAARSLLITRARFGERVPLWMSRLASQRLLARVQRYPDFPVLLEAWRSCLEESFDLAGLTAMLERLAGGELRVSDVATSSPSPFAAESGWRQINEYMYADDRSRQRSGNATSVTLIETAVRDARLRPVVAPEIARAFIERRRRLLPGWGPSNALELRDWLRERRLLRREEFDQHRAAIRDQASGGEAMADEIAAADWWRPLPHDPAWIVEIRDLAAAERVLAPAGASGSDDAQDRERLQWLATWLAFEPPATREQLSAIWPGDRARLHLDLDVLDDDGTLIAGVLLEASDALCLCDADNHEAMLRMQRAARREQLTPVAAVRVPDFISRWQRIDAAQDALDAVEGLRALPLPAELWAAAVLPARLGPDAAARLDALLARGEIILTGDGRGRRRDVCLLAADELDLLPPRSGDEEIVQRLVGALPDLRASYDFDALLGACGGDAAGAAELLWTGFFNGRIACEGLESLRHGLATDFSLPPASTAAPASGGARRGGLRARIRARIHGVPGRFRRLPDPDPAGDAVDRLESSRRRARVLVDRWGVVCPALLRREARGLRFGDVFRALRLMELAGEVSTGQFLEGLDGPQFASADAIALIRSLGRDAAAGPDQDRPIARWLDARDPASPGGLGLATAGLPAPARRSGAELVLVDHRVVIVTERGGETLRIDPDADPEQIERGLRALARALSWRANSAGVESPGHLEVRRIDEAPARDSRHLALLERCFDIRRDHRGLVLSVATD